MKIGANTMIWAGDFTQEHLPLIDKVAAIRLRRDRSSRDFCCSRFLMRAKYGSGYETQASNAVLARR